MEEAGGFQTWIIIRPDEMTGGRLNSGFTYSDRIVKGDAGISVLEFYYRHYPRFSEDEWEERIRGGQVSCDGRTLATGDMLATGMLLEYHRPAWEEPEVPTAVDVLLEHQLCMVFDKPAGLPVLPGGGFLEHTLLHIVRTRFGEDLSPMHRLGRGTSGAILFARGAVAGAALAGAMRERRVHKTYLALASGKSRKGYRRCKVSFGS